VTELAAPPAAARQSSLSIFRHRDFTVFFTAAAISNGANWMQLVAVPALLFELTNSGTWLGFSTFCNLIPAVLLTPYAGVLTDRVSRQAIVLVTQTAQMVIAFGLWGLYATGHITPWWIIILGILTGCATGFQTSAWQTFVPLLVPEEEMLHAVKLNSVQFTMARAIGPAAAGWVVAAWGVGVAIFVNAATYLLVILALLVVHARPAMSSSRTEKVWAQLKQGARYVWTRAPLLLAVTLALITSVFGQSLQFVAAAISERVFGHSPENNAQLVLAWGIGSLVASGVAIGFGDRFRRSRSVISGLIVYSAGVALVALGPVFAIGLLGFLFCGYSHLQVSVALNTLIQGAVPDEMRGRTMSFYLLGILAGIPIGGLALGALGDIVGFRVMLFFNASVFALVVVVLIVTPLSKLLDVTHVAPYEEASLPA
jgi:MFS family permease